MIRFRIKCTIPVGFVIFRTTKSMNWKYLKNNIVGVHECEDGSLKIAHISEYIGDVLYVEHDNNIPGITRDEIIYKDNHDGNVAGYAVAVVKHKLHLKDDVYLAFNFMTSKLLLKDFIKVTLKKIRYRINTRV